MTDRETLEKVAKNYNDLIALQKSARVTQAQVIRACIKQLRKSDPAEREKALVALGRLADVLDMPSGGVVTGRASREEPDQGQWRGEMVLPKDHPLARYRKN